MPLHRRTLLAVFALGCSPDDLSASPGEGAQSEPTSSLVVPLDRSGLVVGSVPPRARIFGLPAMELGDGVVALPASGGAPSTIFLTRDSSVWIPRPLAAAFEHFPSVLVLDGDVPPGDHAIGDLWDGVSGVEGPAYGDYLSTALVHAGDVNDDGALDVWLSQGLHHGPFLGRSTSQDDAVAWFETYRSSTVGDFDADGDGHEDLLQESALWYGPFSGAVDAADAEAPGPTLIAADRDSGILPEQLAPGHHAALIEDALYDLMLAPGSVPNEPFAWYHDENSDMSEERVVDVGDVDGDGARDLLYQRDDAGLEFFSGPVWGDKSQWPVAIDLEDDLGWSSAVYESVGDLSGDGLSELVLHYVPRPGDIDTTEWVVLFSPYDDHLRPRGVSLGTASELDHGHWPGGWTVADLDGDGLADLVKVRIATELHDPPDELLEAGEIMVWYGEDIVAAWVDGT